MILTHDFVVKSSQWWPFVKVLKRTARIVDVGAGIRPCLLFPCDEYIAIEPHDEYVEVLRAEWRPENQRVTIVQAEAETVADYQRSDTTVLLVDVIEHLERPRGKLLRDLLEEFEQAIIFTPLGFMQQTTDKWGLHGEHWQTHRSGWNPEDFPNWRVRIWPASGGSLVKNGSLLAIRPK